MRIVFVSNYFNHHQRPFCEAMLENHVGEFYFIQTEEMEAERVSMGWGLDLKDYPYVKCYAQEPEICKELIRNSEVVVFGGTDEEAYIAPRLAAGKLVIRYSERIYKEGQWKFISPRGLRKKYQDHIRYRNKNVYLLCAGAYVASDFHLIGAYPDKMYSWGYFPETYTYSAQDLQDKKSSEMLHLLWTGRMIDWKHPEMAIAVVESLVREKKNGASYPPFQLTMIGEGPLRAGLEARVKALSLEEYVTFENFKRPEEVREAMLRSQIYLFTSDYKEGWGAVLNEAMNSGCCTVASAGIGAVPYLLRHGKNGMVFQSGNTRELQQMVAYLLTHPREREVLGLNAYETIVNRWNAKQAAVALLRFIRSISLGNPESAFDGPMSKAPLLSPRKGYEYTRR